MSNINNENLQEDVAPQILAATIHEYEDKIYELEQRLSSVLEENRVLKDKNFSLTQQRVVILDKIPYGILVCDNEKNIMFSNATFIDFQGYRTQSLTDEYPHLRGVKITDVLPENVCAYLESSLYGNDENIDKTVELGNHKLFMSTYAVRNVGYAFALFRDIYGDGIIKDEIYKRIQEVIDQNMGMVQKIGFLMGEETSKTARSLNSIISSLKEGGK